LEDGRISFIPTLWRNASSAFSIATGAAIGREGSMIQFAAASCSWIGRRIPPGYFSLGRQVAYGTAAVAAVYQAPFAGVFFAIEILLADWKVAELPELISASTTGWLVSSFLLGRGPLFAMSGISKFSGSMDVGIFASFAAGSACSALPIIVEQSSLRKSITLCASLERRCGRRIELAENNRMGQR
jgi:CIC family chloride channel protein